MMSYQIHYKSIFSKRGKLTGYSIILEKGVDEGDKEEYLTLRVKGENTEGEYNRLIAMMAGNEVAKGEYIVTKHPLDILDYVQGVSRASPKSTEFWKKDLLEGWSVNLRGERV